MQALPPWLSRGSAVVVSALAVTVVAAGVGAADTDDGYWYFDNYDVASFHEQGIDGSGVKIAVIDTVIDPDAPFLADANITVHEPSFCVPDEEGGEPVPATITGGAASVHAHGTNVTGFLVGNGDRGPKGIAPRAEITFYSWGDNLGDEDDLNCTARGSEGMGYRADAAGALEAALADDPDIVTLSVTGSFAERSQLRDPIARAMREGVIITSAAPNDDSELGGDATSANGVVGVGSVGADGQVPTSEVLDGEELVTVHNTNEWLDVVAPGVGLTVGGGASWEAPEPRNGTSYATPITAGNVALALQANPEATPNQVLQLLIHNTGVDAPHEPVFDPTGEVGYGVVDTISLLGDDATKYEDVNPFILDGDDQSPTVEEIFGETAATGDPEPSVEASREAFPSPAAPTAEPTTEPAPTDSGNTMTVVWIAVGVVVVVAVVVPVVVVGARRRSGRQGVVR
ncbi:S8 family peptidase [Demequina globuliformis]|uniref:S8 family peptidase n=1 Tax=Demequina globuliformis TaxID=676202 RepID=UPI0007823D71|nr:S8/S53 family peptidase [Demequina globuliformis]